MIRNLVVVYVVYVRGAFPILAVVTHTQYTFICTYTHMNDDFGIIFGYGAILCVCTNVCV